MSFLSKVLSASVAKQTGNSPTVQETSYVVPNQKTVAVEVFYGGHEYSTKEARVELVWRDGGTDTVVAVMYGSTTKIEIAEDFIGDGSKSLVIKASNGDPGKLHMFGKWVGRERDS